MTYLLRVPALLTKLLPDGIWKMPSGPETTVFFTFDDGPHPEITPFVLSELKRYEAQGTFFCVGDNVRKYPEVYQQILEEGHSVGNHTFHHLKGSRTKSGIYLEDVKKAAGYIQSSLFRPPYGRIRHRQAKLLVAAGYRTVYWSLLTGDFDPNLSPERCLEQTLLRLRPGDILVFHDSAKAWDRLRYALPRLLEYCQNQKFRMLGLPMSETSEAG